MGRTACTEPQCLYNGALYLHLYLYSPYGPYGLYRASVSVQRCTFTLPIPLLPLWAVRPVQSLSVCTTVHFTFTYTSTPLMGRTACTEPQCLYNGALYLDLYLYSPYGPYGLYRASVSVQRCTFTLPIPLVPLCTVQPVQSLSACSTARITFTYTSTPLMDRTTFTEPQCLYNGAHIYLYLCSTHSGVFQLHSTHRQSAQAISEHGSKRGCGCRKDIEGRIDVKTRDEKLFRRQSEVGKGKDRPRTGHANHNTIQEEIKNK